MDKSNTIKLVAGGMVVAVAGIAGGAMFFPVEKEVPVADQATLEALAAARAHIAYLESLPPEVSTEVVTETIVKEVKVDNGKLADVLEAIYQADGDLEFVTDDLKESEIAEIADRLVFEMDVQALAIAAVRAEAIDVLHKESVNGTTLDEDDLERLRIQDDRGEVEVLDRDFEDGDAEVKVTAFFEQDDVKYAADFLVLVKEGKVDEVEVDSIYLR
jgi:hypothetical protein